MTKALDKLRIGVNRTGTFSFVRTGMMDTGTLSPNRQIERCEVLSRVLRAAKSYPVVVINWVQYLGPPVPSPSQILGTSSRFSEDFLGREKEP